jgi:hypothetical protein
VKSLHQAGWRCRLRDANGQPVSCFHYFLWEVNRSRGSMEPAHGLPCDHSLRPAFVRSASCLRRISSEEECDSFDKLFGLQVASQKISSVGRNLREIGESPTAPGSWDLKRIDIAALWQPILAVDSSG